MADIEEAERQIAKKAPSLTSITDVKPTSSAQILADLGADENAILDLDFLNSLSEEKKEKLVEAMSREGSVTRYPDAATEGLTVTDSVRPPPADLSNQDSINQVMTGAITGEPGQPLPRFARQGLQDVANIRKREQLGLEQQAKGEFKAQQAESRKNVAVAAVHQTRAERQARNAQDIAARETIRRGSQQTAIDDIAAANQMVTNFEIDPRRFYKEGYAAIGSTIAVALGAFGAGLTGGPNTALQIIDSAVNRDIAAQRAQLDVLKFGVTQKQNAYSRLMSQHNDFRKVEQLMYEQVDTALLMEIDKTISAYTGLIDAGNLEALKGAVKVRQANRNNNYAAQVLDFRMKLFTEQNRVEAARQARQATKLAAADKPQGFKNADTRVKIKAGLLAKGLLQKIEAGYKKNAEGMGEGVFSKRWFSYSSLWGAFEKLAPFQTERELIMDMTMELSQQMVYQKSGTAARPEEFDREWDKMAGYTDNWDTIMNYLGNVATMVDNNHRAIYPTLDTDEKKYWDATGLSEKQIDVGEFQFNRADDMAAEKERIRKSLLK